MASSKNYSETHEVYRNKNFDYEKKKKQLDLDLKKTISKKDKNIRILDIGCGIGIFAYYCKKDKFKDYTGIDTDNNAIRICKEKFHDFRFHNIDAIKFLANNKKKYDLIFMSHVLEHFSADDGDRIISLISKSLSDEGTFINIMPNADAILGVGTLRYGDLTHKTLYNTRSFNQHLLKYFKDKDIIHINNRLSNNAIIRLFHKISVTSYKIYLYSLGFRLPEVYSQDIISVIKK